MHVPFFTVTLSLELLLTGSFLWSVLFPRNRIWPPPGWKSWRFWCVWILTVSSLAGFFTVSLLEWNSFVFPHWSRFVIGGAIFLSGTLFALWGVATLGLRTAAGLEGELVTYGPYRYSRNPQYFGDFGVLLGWAIISNSWLSFILSSSLRSAFSATTYPAPLVLRRHECFQSSMTSTLAPLIGRCFSSINARLASSSLYV